MTLSPRREPTRHSPPALTSPGAAQSQDPLGAWDPQAPIGPSPPSLLASIPRENQEARRLGPGTDCHRFWTRSQQLGNCPGKGAVPGCHVPPTHRPGPTWKLRSRSPLGSGLLSMWLVTRRPRWSRGALMTGSSHEEGATDTQGHAKGPERCCHTPRGVRAAGNHGGQGSGGRRPFPPPPGGLQRRTALPTPRFWTYGPQDREGTHSLFHATEPEAICSRSPANKSSYFTPCTPNSDAEYW